jgi:lambda repressor-like predicted transcriptional regulator
MFEKRRSAMTVTNAGGSGTPPVRDNSTGDISLLGAYIECDDAVRRIVDKMVAICLSDESSDDEKRLAGSTIYDALFPVYPKGVLGDDLEEAVSDLEVEQSLDEQEHQFANRVKSFMESKGISQIELSERTGVNQSAISMMLSRNCRPQRRTVRKIAQALGVSEGDLWK